MLLCTDNNNVCTKIELQLFSTIFVCILAPNLITYIVYLPFSYFHLYILHSCICMFMLWYVYNLLIPQLLVTDGFFYNLRSGWHIFIYFTPNLYLRTGVCNVYLIMIWFETGNLEWKVYLLHADRKRLPRTFVCSENADVFHWTWRRPAAESDVTVRLTFGIADVTLRLYINTSAR